jgi:hypothetical protein
MTLRLTSSSLAGMSRKLVAVGTRRLVSMFSTMRAATPRSGWPGCSACSGFSALAAGAGAAGAGCGAGAAGAGAAGAGAGGAMVPAALLATGVAIPLPEGVLAAGAA